ncbi:MAG: AtpZ/AtpI family protein [Planctomycetota bacterium]|nr:AtpZ/AtpI family protein [Planctomycetota bacterium]
MQRDSDPLDKDFGRDIGRHLAADLEAKAASIRNVEGSAEPPPVPQVLKAAALKKTEDGQDIPGSARLAPSTGRVANMGRVWAIGGQLGFSVMGGVLIGFGFDYWFKTTPIFLLLFALAGLVSGMRTFWREAKKINAKPDDRTSGGAGVAKR